MKKKQTKQITKQTKISSIDLDTSKNPIGSAFEYYNLFDKGNVDSTEEDVEKLFNPSKKRQKRRYRRHPGI